MYNVFILMKKPHLNWREIFTTKNFRLDTINFSANGQFPQMMQTAHSANELVSMYHKILLNPQTFTPHREKWEK